MHLRRLARQSATYGGGRVVLQALGVVTIPIFTRVFDPHDYGVIDTITSLALVLALFASLGLESGSQRSYYDYSDNQPVERRAVLSTAFWTVAAVAGALAVVGVLLSSAVSTWMFGTARYRDAVALAFATVPLLLLTNLCLEALRLRNRPLSYSVLALLGGGASVCGAILFAAVLNRGLTGYFTGLLVGSCVGLAAGLVFARGLIGFSFDRRKLDTMLRFGILLVPVAAATWILQLVDRFFLLRYSTVSQIGLYALAVRLSNVLLLVVTAFGLAWSPFVLEIHQRDAGEERRLRPTVLDAAALVLVSGAVVLSVFARDIFEVATPAKFVGAYEAVGLLTGGIVAVGINLVGMTGISIKRRTGYFARYALYSGALNIGLNFALIPPLAMVGAALATFLSYAALSTMYFWRAHQLDPVDFGWRRLAKILGVGAAVIIAGTLIYLQPLWLDVTVKLALVAAFPVTLWLIGGLDARFVERAKRVLATLPRIRLAG